MAKKFPWTASVLALAVSSAFAQSASQTTQQSTSPYQIAYLDPVVVTANRYEEEYRVIPAYVTYISRKDIEESNVQTVNEAIIRLGGLVGRASLYGGREQNIDIMGFGDTAQSNTIILLDGMPLNEADMSEVRVSGIPIESVEAIEIHRSSAGVLYGGGANGGVINIITKMSQSDNVAGFGGSAYVGLGSFNSQEYRLTARHAAAGLSLFFSGTYVTSDGYRQNSFNKDKTGFFSARYATGPALFGFSVSSDNQNVRTPGPLTEADFRVDPRAAQLLSLVNKTYNDISQQKFAAFAELDAGFAILRADGYTRTRDVDALAIQYGSPVGLSFSGESNYWALSARKPYESPAIKNQLLVGYENTLWNQNRTYVRDYIDPTYGSRDSLRSNSKSYFIRNDFDVRTTSTRLSVGYRSERDEKSYRYETGFRPYLRDFSQHAAELGVSQTLNKQITIYLRAARSYRFSNLDEIPGAYLQGIGSFILRPQVSRDFELGVKYALESGGRFQVRAYQSRLNDEIIYDVLRYSNINLDRTQRSGIDIDGSLPVTKALRFTGALSIRKAEFTEGQYSGKEIPMSLPQTVLLGASWQPTVTHRFGVDAQWVARQRPAGDYDNLYQVPSYWVANLRYDYRAGNLTLSGTVKNLFDRSYYSYATVVPADWNGNPQYIGVYPDNGRSFWLSARYRFN